MKFGKPYIYKCQSCEKPLRQLTFMSYTVRASRLYSDGYREGGIHVTPDPAKCPHCGCVFFMRRQKKHKAKTMRLDVETIETPDSQDYADAIKNNLAVTKKEELLIRTGLWRSLNNITRHGGKFTKKEQALWRKNCEELLKLMQEKPNKNKDDVINTYITIMELHRNLGQFEKCMDGIKEIAGPLAYEQFHKDYSWLEKQYANQCKKENIFVFELKRSKQ